MVRLLSPGKLFASAIAVGVVAAACGGGAAPTATQAPSQPAATARPTAAPTPTPTRGPTRGGTLQLRVQADPSHLEIHTSAFIGNIMAYNLVGGKLTRFKHGPAVGPQELILEPFQAESWAQSQDGKSWTIKLRKGIKWQNVAPVNGRELVADDVKFTIDYSRKASPNVWVNYYNWVTDVEAVDPYTVKVNTFAPVSDQMKYFAHAHVSNIVAKEVAARDGNFKNALIGTGPYILENFEHNVALRFKRNPDYFRSAQGLPYLDSVVINIMPDDAQALAALRTGQLHFDALTAFSAQTLARTNPELKTENYLEGLVPAIQFQFDVPPFNDVRVRRAYSMALNRERMVQTVLQGQGVVTGFISPALGKFALDWKQLPYYPYDPAGAKKLLQEAGYDFSKEVVLDTTPGYGDTFRSLAEASASDLKELGINIKLNVRQHSEFMTRNVNATFDQMIFAHMWSPFPFFDNYIVGSHTKNPKTRNRRTIENADLDRLAEAYRGALNEADQIKAAHDFQRYMAENAWNVATAWFYNAGVYRPELKNFRPSFRGNWFSTDAYEDAWLER